VFERFTDRARRSVVFAQEEARLLDHNYIGTEHILLGLLRQEDGVAARALSSLGVSVEAARGQVRMIIGEGTTAPGHHIPFTPRAKKVLELSLREALQLGHNYIGTEHVLLGLIREGEGVAVQVLEALGADRIHVRQSVLELMSGYMAGAEVRSVEGETEMEGLTSEEARTSEPLGDDAPTCPNCFGALDETLAVRVVETTAEGEPISIKIAYCTRCGVALGAAP
jgi:ATP-dependent Clp protease ATP-binding subunit ClpC